MDTNYQKKLKGAEFKKMIVKKGFVKALLFSLLSAALSVIIIGKIVYRFTGSNLGYFIGVAVQIIYYFLITFFVGEYISRRNLDCVKLENYQDNERLFICFNEVYKQAKQVTPSLPKKIKLLMTFEDMPIACVIGRKAIVIDEYVIKNSSDSELKAILSRELGHIANKHSILRMLVYYGESVLIFLLKGVKIITCILYDLQYRILTRFIGNELILKFLQALLFVYAVVLETIMYDWQKIGQRCCKRLLHEIEYGADEYAVKLGYGQSFINWIEGSGVIDFDVNGNPLDVESFTHPKTSNRIKRIQTLLNSFTDETHPSGEINTEILSK